ncbi:MAG: hypothetical protein RQ745_09895 [Longimicrobiales bacterium]|nr:hypothetical protein [Longimicrobiales bacterium]
MSAMREVRSFEYVNRPYEEVRAALTADPLEVFRSATRAAADRVRSLAAELRVSVVGVEVGAEIAISVSEVEEVERGPTSTPATRIHLEWQAAEHPRLFPLMDGVLALYALTSTETQLDFSGRYDPPFGPLGDALDAVAMGRVAEASVDRFVKDLAHHLRAGE